MAGEMRQLAQTKIGQAIIAGDIKELKTLIANGENVHFKDWKGNNYIHFVCTMYRPFIFYILAAEGVEVNVQNRYGYTPLHVTAAKEDNSCHVADLFVCGADPNIKTRDNRTPLDLCMKNRYWRTVYEHYKPGIFEAVKNHDVNRVLELLQCWCKVDSVKNRQTIRQYAAALRFHDIVGILDHHQHTMNAIYGVLEVNHEKVKEAVKKTKCNINFLNKVSQKRHILQHALLLKDYNMVQILCDAGADVNVSVLVKHYFRGPLFFEAISSNIPPQITWKILMSNADFSIKDEKGRNAMIYAVDRCNGFISVDFFKYMLKKGAYIADRDDTGSTIRDVARFARRMDLLAVIEKFYIAIIRRSDIDTMRKLTVDGYDGMLIHFNYKDTFIYASGNETDDMVQYIQWLPTFQKEVEKFHKAIRGESLSNVISVIESSSAPEMLVNAKDKGLRSPLILATLFSRTDVVKYLLKSDLKVDVNAKDCVNKTAYHYAVMLDTDGEDIQQLLLSAKIDTEQKDMNEKKAEDYQDYLNKQWWLKKQRMGRFGLTAELQCIDKYEELKKIIRGKRKGVKHFEECVKRFSYPVAAFPKILEPLVPCYHDLIFLAVDYGKQDIAVRLADLGSDLSRKEKYSITNDQDEKCEIMMNAVDRAWHLQMNDLAAILTQKQERQLQKRRLPKRMPVRTTESRTVKSVSFPPSFVTQMEICR